MTTQIKSLSFRGGDVDESTNYRVLLDLIQQFKVDSEPVLLATFNYDCLLEMRYSMSWVTKFVKIDDYATADRLFPLFKLRG
jgi:hypothetical protein